MMKELEYRREEQGRDLKQDNFISFIRGMYRDVFLASCFLSMKNEKVVVFVSSE
jgi:hypothetical protein